MRHALFNRNNPPPETRWQRRINRVRRFARDLCGDFVETVHGFRVLLSSDAMTVSALLALLIQDQFHEMAATAEPGRPVGAWINFVVQIAIVIVAAVVSAAMAPKPPQPKPASLGAFDVPTAEEGRPVAKIFGEVWVPDPNNLWYGDLGSEPIKKKGGKK